MIATALVLRGNDPRAPRSDVSSLAQIVKQAVTPHAVEVAPSIFDSETALGPRVLISRWDPLIAEASRRFKVPEKWIRAVMRMESGGRTVLEGDTPITSDAGAVGIMQVLPGTYAEMSAQYGLGSDPFDPRDNIMAGTAYLRWLHGKYGYPAMFAAYNNGPGNLEAHLNKGRKLPTETRNYIAGIAKILGVATETAKMKFTRPDGTPVLIDLATVSGLRAALPGEFDDSVQAVLNIGTQRQAVREDLATIAAMMRGRNV
jgi:membrane-bound lytic murein transglycosylase B